MSPSDLGGAKALPGEPLLAADDGVALARGRALHLLLEHLPAMPSADWERRGREMIGLVEDAARIPDPEAVLGEAIALVSDPALSALFGSETLAEVEISAALPELAGKRIFGAVDRLAVTPTAVHVIDFKSNRVVPQRVEDVPEGLLRQMGAYAAALGQIYPGREIRASLVWTANRQMTDLPLSLIRAALLRAGGP